MLRTLHRTIEIVKLIWQARWRHMLILLVMACSSSSLSPSQSEESDPYSVHLLHVAMKTRSEGLFIAKVQTHMARMGDKVSIALLKDLSESELLDPNKVEEYLPIIQESFSQPQFIEVEIDKRAKVTMFLLKHVRQGVLDDRVQQDVDNTIRFVEEKTSKANP